MPLGTTGPDTLGVLIWHDSAKTEVAHSTVSKRKKIVYFFPLKILCGFRFKVILAKAFFILL